MYPSTGKASTCYTLNGTLYFKKYAVRECYNVFAVADRPRDRCVYTTHSTVTDAR